jgi:hypothetical protein
MNMGFQSHYGFIFHTHVGIMFNKNEFKACFFNTFLQNIMYKKAVFEDGFLG